ncbi:hypothetical protein SDC9_184636 [bioreactor metagenome]|uniref:Uncharacterized protein n=1 Tax=bioreactor metagenome TaxID=1076179 RepID=A0A645HEH0_9ZZZZ
MRGPLRQLTALHRHRIGQRRCGHAHVGQRTAQDGAFAAPGLHVGGRVARDVGLIARTA